MILDAEEKYEKASTNISGIPELLDRFMLALSAVSGIPTSLLFGRSAAGLNATGDNDVRNFYDMVKQEQENKLKPVLEKLTRYIMLSKDGPFAGSKPPFRPSRSTSVFIDQRLPPKRETATSAGSSTPRSR